MAETDSLQARMSSLEDRIAEARERLTLHSTLHEQHAATLDELTERYLHLQQQLQSQAVSLEAQGVHVDSFEKTLLTWINGLTLHH